MTSKSRMVSLLAGASLVALIGGTALYAQIVTGTQDFSIVVGQGVDETPDAFAFAALLDRPTGRVFETAETVITGMDAGTSLSITGGEYSLNNGSFTAASGVINPGDTVVVRVTSSSTNEETVTALLTVGDVTEGFSVTTRPADACDGDLIAVGATCFDGAVFAGTVGGERIFVAPSNEGAMQWKTSRTYTPGTYSDDGLKNFDAIRRLGISDFPAASACAAKGPDWYLPSLAEFNAIRANLSASEISATFQAGSWHLTSETWGTEKFGTALSGGTSTDNPGYVYAFVPDTGAGGGRVMDSAVSGLVHCVRHDGTREAPVDPCDEVSPEVGSLCLDGTVYAGEHEGRKLFIATDHEGILSWGASEDYAPGTYGDDGFMNSGAMRQIGVASFPGLAACAARGDEWYLPSLAEFQAVRANLGTGLRSHAFPGGINQLHMTSESYGSGKGGTSLSDQVRFAYAYSPANDVVSGRDKDFAQHSYVHCFKAEAGRTYTDPCNVGSPEPGALCSNGTIYVADLNGEPFFIASESEGVRALKTVRSATAGTSSETDGVSNTDAMISAGGHPAAATCRAKGPNWYLPARSELDLAWELDVKSVRHSFFAAPYSAYHWTSTQYPSNTNANWVQRAAGEGAYFKNASATQVRCAYKTN